MLARHCCRRRRKKREKGEGVHWQITRALGTRDSGLGICASAMRTLNFVLGCLLLVRQCAAMLQYSATKGGPLAAFRHGKRADLPLRMADPRRGPFPRCPVPCKLGEVGDLGDGMTEVDAKANAWFFLRRGGWLYKLTDGIMRLRMKRSIQARYFQLSPDGDELWWWHPTSSERVQMEEAQQKCLATSREMCTLRHSYLLGRVIPADDTHGSHGVLRLDKVVVTRSDPKNRHLIGPTFQMPRQIYPFEFLLDATKVGTSDHQIFNLFAPTDFSMQSWEDAINTQINTVIACQGEPMRACAGDASPQKDVSQKRGNGLPTSPLR